MKIVIPKEVRPHEGRVAASPETVKKLVALGCNVVVEEDAGLSASIPDSLYKEAGAKLSKGGAPLYKDAKVILKVQKPLLEKGKEISHYPKGATVIATLGILNHPEDLNAYKDAGINAVALELVPRITRAQTMDVLSSQSNLAGYRAVLEAASVFDRAFPMMMTAAGTILPAKVLVIGAGVAGLQAIATARRLGAVVMAYDVRAAAKEQVESLGATFIQVDETMNAETSGGYAKEMDEAYKKRQAQKLAETVQKVDVIITTALIPGRPAPLLLTEDMVKSMKPGSVIVDLAVESGGNCSLSEFGKTVEKYGVKIVGPANLVSQIARDASDLFARNIFNLFKLLFDEKEKKIVFSPEDEIVSAILLTHEGKVLRSDLLTKTEEKKVSAKKETPKKASSKNAPTKGKKK